MKQDVIENIGVIYGLPVKSIDILNNILEKIDVDNKVQLDTAMRISIFNKTGKSIETINKYIGLLVKHKIFLRIGKGYYQASSKLFTDSWNSLSNDSTFRIIMTFKDSKRIVRVKVIIP